MKTLAQRLAEAKAKAAKKAHQDRIADRKYTSSLNRERRENSK